MTMNELIMKAREKKCSDIHISEGMPVSFRIHGQRLFVSGGRNTGNDPVHAQR